VNSHPYATATAGVADQVGERQITINIGNEVRDSTKLLSGMNDTFDETGGFLGGTMKKMNKMARKQGGQWCLCELV
jgi:hypothetical protein